MQMVDLVGDAGYSSGEALQYLEDKNINAWIPNFGQYKPMREGFVYDQQLDQYACVQEGGNKAILPFKKQMVTTKGYEMKSYRSSEKVCGNCPLREKCIGKNTSFKKINDTIHKPLYDRMHQKLTANKAYHRHLVKRRSATVEPVLGTLINVIAFVFFAVKGLVVWPLAALMAVGATIGGWVAMWRPLEIYLYDWWPLRAEYKMLERLSRLHVRLVLPETS
jgi:hypothetical protein